MDSTTNLHRQIHPTWVEDDQISSQAFDCIITSQSFTPTEKDNKKLSVANGEKISPQKSYELHIEKGLQSIGVVSVVGSECDSVSLSYIEDNSPYDGHSYIDYSPCTSKGDIKTRAKKLKAFAIARGWTYTPQKNNHN